MNTEQTNLQQENFESISQFRSGTNLTYRNSMNSFARSFALSLNNQTFQEFNRKELRKEWGGDFQYLVHLKYYDKISSELTFSDVMRQHEFSTNSEDKILGSKNLRVLATEHTSQKLSDQGYKNVVVVVGPEVDTNEGFFDGYTLSGEKVTLSASHEPDYPVFIVGYCEICNEEQASRLYDNQDQKDNFRRTNGYGEYITWLQVPDVSDIENWSLGKPELKAAAIAYNSNASGVELVKEAGFPSYSRSTWESGANFGLDPSFQMKGWFIFNWYYTQWHGTTYFLKIWEIDGGPTLNLTWTVNNGSGGTATYNYTGIRYDDDQCDGQSISYPDATPGVYNPGVINYNIKNIQ